MSEFGILGGFGAAAGGLYYLTNRDIFYSRNAAGKRGDFDFVRFNYVLAVLHAAAAMSTYVILRDQADPEYLAFNLTDVKFADNPTPPPVFNEEVHTIQAPLSVLNATVMFYLVTAFTHLIYAMVWKTGYIKSIGEGHNPIRWIEYSVSATIMIYLVSLISGVRDINAIIPILGANIGTMYTGYISEEAIRRGDFESARHAIQLGWVLQIFIYITLFRKFFSIVGDLRSIEDPPGTPKFTIPPWLYFVIVPTVLFYGSFGVVATLWYSKAKKVYEATGALPDFRPTEKLYLYLSLFSKLFLGLYIAYGYTQRGDVSAITP
jgi:hypothetical protein